MVWGVGFEMSLAHLGKEIPKTLLSQLLLKQNPKHLQTRNTFPKGTTS